MLRLNKSLDGLRFGTVHRFATLWRIERTDGTSFLFTDHDVPLTFNYQKSVNAALFPGTVISGTDEDYLPSRSITATAVQKQAGLKEHNVDVSTVITSDLITEDDLRAGKYRDARVVELLVDWKYPYAGYFYQNTYYILSATYTREFWQAQVSGVPSWMQMEIGKVYAHECRHDLGDSLCQKDLTDFTADGTVSVLVDGRTFVATATITTDDWYDDGILTWTSGNNTGDTYDIQGNIGPTLTLQLNTTRAIQVGDTFTAVAGCNKLKSTCKDKFDNFVRFGGFPFIPGNDTMIKGALG